MTSFGVPFERRTLLSYALTMRSLPRFALCLGLLVFQNACGLLVGNIKPVDEKSDDYGVLDLSRDNSNWVKLDPKSISGREAKDEGTSPTEISDVVFQSKQTASTISLNSACREGAQAKDLRSITNLLFFGINDISVREEHELAHQGYPALETTLKGKLSREPVMLRTLVIKKNECVYEMIYLAPPAKFEQEAPDFSRFVASLKLKD